MKIECPFKQYQELESNNISVHINNAYNYDDNNNDDDDDITSLSLPKPTIDTDGDDEVRDYVEVIVCPYYNNGCNYKETPMGQIDVDD